MIDNTIRVCPIHNFIACSLDSKVTEEYKKTGEGCVAEVADRLKENDIKKYNALRKDSFTLGWKITHITESILRFEEQIRSKDIIRDTDQNPINIFKETKIENDPHNSFLKPVTIAENDLTRKDYFHVRGSEFHSKCPLQILYSTFDQKRVGEVKNIYTESGTARHLIAAGSCQHGNKLAMKEFSEEKRRVLEIDPKLFSEKTVDFIWKNNWKDNNFDISDLFTRKEKSYFSDIEIPNEIVLRGTADYIFTAGNDDEYIVIWDNKRYTHRFYEKTSTKFQMLGYALAFEQISNKEYEGYILISEHRPNRDDFGDVKLPMFHATFVRKNDRFIREFYRELVKHYAIKKSFIDKPELTREVYELMRTGKTRSCSNLFGNKGCFLYNGQCEKNLEIIEKEKDINKLFITEFK